jgi:hypothetical protein
MRTMIKAKTGQPRASAIRTMNSNSDIAGGLYPSAVGQTDGELLAARVARQRVDARRSLRKIAPPWWWYRCSSAEMRLIGCRGLGCVP